MVRFLPYVLASLLFFMVLFLGLNRREEGGLSTYKPSVELPDLRFTTVDGRELKLSELKGKVVLVNFWATWCPPCKEEMPIFEREYRRCKEKGFEVLAVNMDSSEGALKRFLEENSYSFTIVKPVGDLEREVKLMGFPTSYLLGKDGKVHRIRLGIYRELEMDLKELLGC